MALSGDLRDRLVSLALGVPSWSVLGVAAWLQPDPAGLGTHRQLGLGQCTLLGLTGWPCPMCGMTTSFSHMAHLEPLGALGAQPFGVVLFLLTTLAAGVAIAELARPRGRWVRALAWIEEHELKIAIGLLAGLAGGWLYKILVLKVLISS